MKLPFLFGTIVLLLGALFSPMTAPAQDLTGIWRGYFNTYSGEDYKFEIQIEQTKSNRISGVSYSYLDTRFYGKAALTGNFNKVGKAALIQEIKTVELKMSGGSYACIMKCSFIYTRSGNEEFLDGTYTSTFEKTDSLMGIRRGEDCGGGTIHLRRVVQSDFYVEPFLREKQFRRPPPVQNNPPANTTKPATKPPVNQRKPAAKPPVKKPAAKPPVNKKVTNTTAGKDSLVVKKATTIIQPKDRPKIAPMPVITRSRENELVKTFTVSDDEVIVKFFDNGEIDNDTISVYLDGKPIITNQRLSTVPITVKIKMTEDNPEHTLVMVAENLGRIPPNTSLMIVQDGNNRYQASITSTEQKNAMVRFRYVKREP